MQAGDVCRHELSVEKVRFQLSVELTSLGSLVRLRSAFKLKVTVTDLDASNTTFAKAITLRNKQGGILANR
jgi:hypothetical protein